MNKNYLLAAYALTVIFICTGVGYKLGYEKAFSKQINK